MGKINVTETTLKDALLVEPAVFGDHRGFFTESYSDKDFKEAGLDFEFIQDNHSLSVEAGVLRGLHFQEGQAAQTKLIRVITGVVYDVIVDMRAGSPTFGKWEGFILSASNQRQLLVPKGFAHGFLTLTPDVNFVYKCDGYYNAEADAGIAFDDTGLGIDWPIDISKAILSDKDKQHPTFEDYIKHNTFVYGGI
ncbi:dTDP-4-dehydrorhamnose 3,5-epimerase [Vagococcus fluvialis]|uniref:dTDP-4-dehydrorhamnose 3,5-epimerase n=1 Tax=Vagococcus fluvialis TaxID=2738 RepID=UPI001432D88C|nr:dTDP-4-dehydrorhamnose 3,5-epimerase [Vagococcus fluvialis]NKC59715.1 dTDP-4-dehydrorhamnose 3,5-epimerase [Vagococcus fluvialis]NKD50612.1 dTDP-4-dehydrorhamnose 3,5-epimerase [Vagococcus fluvialis]